MNTSSKKRPAHAAETPGAANAGRFHAPAPDIAVPGGQHLPEVTRPRRRPAGQSDAHPSRALRDAAETFATFIGPMRLTALVLDTNADVVYANPLLLELTGWRADEVFGRPWFDRFVEPPTDTLREAFAAVLADDPEVAIYTMEVLKRDGGRSRVRWHNALVREDGGVVGTASIGEVLDEDAADVPPLPETVDLGPAGIIAMTRALVARPEETALPFLRMIAEQCAQLADECGTVTAGTAVGTHIRRMFGLEHGLRDDRAR